MAKAIASFSSPNAVFALSAIADAESLTLRCDQSLSVVKASALTVTRKAKAQNHGGITHAGFSGVVRFDLLDHFDGPVLAGTWRQLDVRDGVALILDRQERGG